MSFKDRIFKIVIIITTDHPLQRGIRKFEHPTQQGSFNQNDGVGEQPADRVSVNIIDL